MYSILITYNSGNSFHNEYGLKEIIGDFKNIETAKENMKRIKEHNEMCKRFDSYSEKLPNYKIVEEYKDKKWLHKDLQLVVLQENEQYFAIDESGREKYEKKYGKENISHIIRSIEAQSSLYLITDEGKEFRYSCAWIGYFETLVSIEVILSDESLKIDF